MQGPYAIHEFKHAVDEFLALAIVQAAQCGAPTQVTIVVRITSGAPERTLAGDFDGERWALAVENFAPRANDIGSLQSIPFSVRYEDWGVERNSRVRISFLNDPREKSGLLFFG
jgi:hypothetical protein